MLTPYPCDIDDRFESIAVEPLTGMIGARITGVDLKTIKEETASDIVDALHSFHALFFPEQHLDIEEQRRFSQIFGELMRVPFVRPMAEHPDVIAVLKEANETGMGVFGGDWHSDFSFLPAPPMGSVLNAVEVPEFGGDTLWCNMVAAYRTLPDALRERVDDRFAIHTGAPYGQRHAPPEEARMRDGSIVIDRGNPEADVETRHPVVCRHPGSGDPMLFVNPIYTVGIEGLPEGEGRALLNELFTHCTRPELCCRFRWQAGTVAVWDNRSTMHFAVNDYDGSRRLLYRTTIAGEPPIPAFMP